MAVPEEEGESLPHAKRGQNTAQSTAQVRVSKNDVTESITITAWVCQVSVFSLSRLCISHVRRPFSQELELVSYRRPFRRSTNT